MIVNGCLVWLKSDDLFTKQQQTFGVYQALRPKLHFYLKFNKVLWMLMLLLRCSGWCLVVVYWPKSEDINSFSINIRPETCSFITLASCLNITVKNGQLCKYPIVRHGECIVRLCNELLLNTFCLQTLSVLDFDLN